MVQPRSRAFLAPRPPGGPPCPESRASHAVDHLADWLTRNNRQFAANLANRTWFHLMGRGIVEPVDDFRESNPPSNPALLDALTDYLIDHGMRLKPLVAFIMNSQTYQLGATPTATNADDTANFARAAVRLLPAEVLLDAISQVLDVPDRFPGALCACAPASFPGCRPGSPFLSVFGKPERLLTCECERNETTTLAQAFQMINGEVGPAEAGRRPATGSASCSRGTLPAESILEELYLAALCREPTPAERSAILAHVRKAARPARRLARRGLGHHQQQGIPPPPLR